MAKTADLYTRIEPEVKEKAENILSTLGISASNAINLFYKQIILQNGLPFNVKIPNRSFLNMSNMTDLEINEELEKGYEDIKKGRVKGAKKVFEEIYKDYKI